MPQCSFTQHNTKQKKKQKKCLKNKIQQKSFDCCVQVNAGGLESGQGIKCHSHHIHLNLYGLKEGSREKK
jgi:hypothetical protein